MWLTLTHLTAFCIFILLDSHLNSFPPGASFLWHPTPSPFVPLEPRTTHAPHGGHSFTQHAFKFGRMSWWTAEQVAQLISVARLRGDVDQATRKSADLRFLDLCANGVNAGDALIHVATEASASPALRLNALLAAETLFTEKGWCEGAQFSDRSAVTKRLLYVVSIDPSFVSQRKLDAGLLRCLAKIVALEFPTTEWQEWVRQCAVKFAEGDARHCDALCAVVAESYRNYFLWSFLANDVADFLLHAQITTLPLRTAVMRLFLGLMRKRPRPAAEHEVPSSTNCMLLSAAVRQHVLAALLERVQELGLLTEALSDILVADCTASFAVASHLIADTDTALTVFNAFPFSCPSEDHGLCRERCSASRSA
ncbi:hypothetical protein, conserved [Leishmania tarentolae]|uniref:Uncharacterized protein n=1 Tax=Leishmania tarentolae TaxID=5689 RepID=A0A640KQN8_LEITA|nr:hypothetical protein, conserved [Leishmania tarentolae]